jgi:hypothetical protein
VWKESKKTNVKGVRNLAKEDIHYEILDIFEKNLDNFEKDFLKLWYNDWQYDGWQYYYKDYMEDINDLKDYIEDINDLKDYVEYINNHQDDY